MTSLANYLLVAFGTSLLSTGSGFSAVVLAVTEDPSGNGIVIEASGNLDFSSGFWIRDGSFVAGPNNFISDTGVTIRPPFGVSETYFFRDSVVQSSLPFTMIFESLESGLFGNSFTILGSFFTLNQTSGLADDMAPSQQIFDFDFVLKDNDGNLADYVDGEVIWDSNGAARGGQQIRLAVAEPIPEPCSSLLLAVATLSGLWRRKKPLSST